MTRSKKRKHDPPPVTIDNDDDLEQLLAGTIVDTSTILSEQGKFIQFSLDKLNNGITYINETDPFKNRRNQKRKALKKITNRILALNQRQAEIDAEMVIQQNIAASQAIDAHADIKGKAAITFVNMGMGDCTLITTPNGVRIMIDCGSDAMADVRVPAAKSNKIDAETHIRNTIFGKTFLNGADFIHLLFLTHPDADHYNKLKTILEPLNARFGIVYYGGTEKIESFAGLGGSSYLKTAAGATGASLRKITYREEKKLSGSDIKITRTINGKDLPGSGQKDTFSKEYIDPATKAMVIYYEDNFRVSVLAGNVTGIWATGEDGNETFMKDNVLAKGNKEMRLTATPQNVRSLVILVECFNKKVLICGDATAITEKFVTENFLTQLGKIDILRMGHHGSPTSSAVAFLNAMTSLETVVASTGGLKTKKHFLPKKKILDLFQSKVSNGCAKHNIFAYKKGDQRAIVYFRKIDTSLWTTGSNDTYSFIVDSTTK